MTAVAKVYRWEVAKLLAQKRTYLGLGAAMLVPLVFVVVLVLQTGGPNDVPLGRYIRETGLATPFVVLFFMSIWGFPLITALVAGDIVAAETHNGTLKTILTRSRERGQVFAGKVLASFTYTLAVIVGMAFVGTVAASIAWGFHPLTSLSGTKVSAGHGLGLLAASLGVYLLPLAGIAAFGLLLSTVTRNSAASVVGTLMWALLMQLIGVLPGTESFRAYLLGTQFEAWHGFLRTPADWAPVVRAFWVCALYIGLPLAAAYVVFLRRDVAGEVDYALAGFGADVDPSAVGLAGIVARFLAEDGRKTELAPPYDARSVFAAARGGDPLGRHVVDDVARRIALHVGAIAAVADVALVVLGGGLGVNGDLLLEPVRSLLAEWLPYPPRVEVSSLGEAAVLTGALAVGLHSALDNVFVNRAGAQVSTSARVS